MKKIVAAALAAGCLFLGGCLRAPVPPAAETEPSGTAQGESASTAAVPGPGEKFLSGRPPAGQ